MTRTTTFRFDDLPLQITDGWEAAGVSGSAAIGYDPAAASLFWVDAVYLDAAKRRKYSEEELLIERLTGKTLPMWTYKSIKASDVLTQLISARLANSSDVLDHIHDDIEANRDDARDYQRDRRREYASEM